MDKIINNSDIISDISPKKRRLDIGDIESLFIEFKSYDAIQSFKNGADDAGFLTKISETTRHFNNLRRLRENCRHQATRFNFSLEMFNRIPMWFFRYLAAQDPLCKKVHKSTKLEIMSIFMIINEINPVLMMAFFIEAGQSIDDCMQLHTFFCNMKILHNITEDNLKTSYLGDSFTFHCKTKTLRRVDMTLVQCPRSEMSNEPFIPYSLQWQRERLIRKMIRTGRLSSMDDVDMKDIKESWQNGLRLKGSMKSK